MAPKPVQPGWFFWLQWLVATATGFIVSLYWIEIGERSDLGLVEGLIGGAVVGVVQGLLLRHYLAQSWQWILATIAGWGLLGWSSVGAIGWVVPEGVDDLSLRVAFGVIEGIKIGVILGWLQGWALKQQAEYVVRWILINTMSWSMALALGWAVGALLRRMTGLFLGEAIGLTLAWVVAASITGSALTQLLDEATSMRQVK